MRFLTLAFVFLGACLPTRSPDHSQLASELSGKTVALVSSADADGYVYCSGTWISSTEILTANHCVEDSASALYVTRDDVAILDGKDVYATRPAKVAARDVDRDLALLVASNAPGHPEASVSPDGLYRGQGAYTMGAPLGMGWSWSSGEIAAIRLIQSSPESQVLAYVQSTAPISPGSSGCGLFNYRGELIGVAQGTLRHGQLLNLFIHRDHVLAFLRNAHAGRA